jgi:hypothetical protein
MLLRNEAIIEGGGYGCEFRFMNGTSGAARNVGLYSVDNVNVADRFVEGNVPWRHTETSYAFDAREPAMNKGREEGFRLIPARIHDAEVDLIKLIESDFWGRPSSSSDTVTPFGLGYWLVYSATEGFNGGNQTGFTSGPGSISASTYTRWQNYTAQYTNITKTDLVRKMRKAAYKTNFMAPRPSPGGTPGSRYGYYTNYDVEEAFAEILEGQNQNLGIRLDPRRPDDRHRLERLQVRGSERVEHDPQRACGARPAQRGSWLDGPVVQHDLRQPSCPVPDLQG